MKHCTQKAYWNQKIEEWKESGLLITEWCHKNSISKSSFYYWRKKIEDFGLKRDSFQELSSTGSSLTIECGAFRICVHEDFNPFLLKSCLGVIKEC